MRLIGVSDHIGTAGTEWHRLVYLLKPAWLLVWHKWHRWNNYFLKRIIKTLKSSQ
jgi:hypothetical protein